ncbi:MAG TPA: efflux RND transporter periplasmic adaptor subunit [Vicinamibacterales bacterium]|nr:efflux RND transporter periplasmic adaptor subunit [Vicinamibacterales bacterium]
MPVTVAPVVQKSMPITIQGIGTVIAASTVAVHAQITGELTSVDFKEGEDVQEGQVLLTLDKRPLEAALAQAQAQLVKDRAQAVNARAQAERYQDLLKRGIATREQVDAMVAQAAALDATVDADQANVDNAKVQLQYATIKAPMTGRTGLLQVHPGNLVRANDTQPIVTINKITPVYVSFSIPEAQLPALKRYLAQSGTLPVSAMPPTDEGQPSLGRLNFIDNAVDPTTGTIKIKGTFPNDDRRLWPGQYVNATVTLTQDPSAVVVPSAAVQNGQSGQYVYVVKADKTVEMRTVTIARTAGDQLVVQSGVKGGETVVTDGFLRLVPGSRVSIKQQGADAPKATS